MDSPGNKAVAERLLTCMSSERHFDAIVIGAGQGGEPLARAFADAKRSTALIERKYVGGTCINYGCTPTKTLYNAARVAYLARRSSDYGVCCGEVSVDMPRAITRVQDVVKDFREETEKRLRATKNLELICDQAKFVGERKIRVGDEVLTADQVFINVGTRAFIPPIDGLIDVPYLDNGGILHVQKLPEHLIVLGGGYIGLEFGQMFRRLGSRVTLVERGKRLIEREDEDVSQTAHDILMQDGIRVIVGTEVKKARRAGANVQIDLASGETVQGSHLLVAIGRVPNTDDLGLDAARVNTNEHGYIQTNERLETSAPGVFAIGDVKGGPAFTHISYDDYRILKANLLKGGNRKTTDRPIPFVMFLDPQLGRVGLSENEAKKTGTNVRVAKINASDIARPIEMTETRGFIKVLVDDKDHIVGVTTFCVDGGELLATFQMAMMAKMPYQNLRDAVISHPTLAECMNNLFLKL